MRRCEHASASTSGGGSKQSLAHCRDNEAFLERRFHLWPTYRIPSASRHAFGRKPPAGAYCAHRLTTDVAEISGDLVVEAMQQRMTKMLRSVYDSRQGASSVARNFLLVYFKAVVHESR